MRFDNLPLVDQYEELGEWARSLVTLLSNDETRIVLAGDEVFPLLNTAGEETVNNGGVVIALIAGVAYAAPSNAALTNPTTATDTTVSTHVISFEALGGEITCNCLLNVLISNYDELALFDGPLLDTKLFVENVTASGSKQLVGVARVALQPHFESASKLKYEGAVNLKSSSQHTNMPSFDAGDTLKYSLWHNLTYKGGATTATLLGSDVAFVVEQLKE